MKFIVIVVQYTQYNLAHFLVGKTILKTQTKQTKVTFQFYSECFAKDVPGIITEAVIDCLAFAVLYLCL